MEKMSIKKSELSFSRKCFLGLLTGLWMALAGCFSLSVAGDNSMQGGGKGIVFIRLLYWYRGFGKRCCRSRSNTTTLGAFIMPIECRQPGTYPCRDRLLDYFLRWLCNSSLFLVANSTLQIACSQPRPLPTEIRFRNWSNYSICENDSNLRIPC